MMSESQWVDATQYTVLAGCSCGWRSDVFTRRGKAWTAVHEHVLTAHPGEMRESLTRVVARYTA